MVDDLAAAEPRVLALGGRQLPEEDHGYADPAWLAKAVGVRPDRFVAALRL